jgi:hypothetical protein
MSLQSELAGKIKELYPNALIKKVDKDNYVDIHLPDVHKKLGTHLFFNTAKGKIKMGFYCRDEEFVKKILEFSDKVEKYSQGVRLADNPEFTSVDDAIAAASEFINLLLLKAEKQKETQHDSNISSEPQNGIVEKEADSGADHFIKIVLYGKGSEFVQGLITQDEFKIYQDFKDKNNLKDDEVAWPAFLEEKSISAERETDKSQYWDYDDVSRFTGINLDSMEIVIYDDNNEVIDTYDYSGFAMQFEESINKNSKILTKNYGKHLSGKQSDCLVTYMTTEKCKYGFVLPDTSDFDPVKLGFTIVATDEMGNAEDYGDFCLGIIYNGIVYKENYFETFGGSEEIVVFSNVKQKWHEDKNLNESSETDVSPKLKNLQEQMVSITNAKEFISFIEKEGQNIDANIAYTVLSEPLQKDKEVISYLLANYKNMFHWLHEEIRKDKSFILEWFEKVKEDLKQADEALKNDPKNPELIKAQKKAAHVADYAPYILTGIHETLINDEDILKTALTTSVFGSVIEKLDPDLWGINKEWAVKVAKYNITTVYFLPKDMKKSVETCKALLNLDCVAFKYFDDEMKQNNTIQEHALKINGYVFTIFPEDLKSNKEYIKSILDGCWDSDDQRGYMVFSANEPLDQDPELIDLAIERNVQIFHELYPKDKYSKELFVYYLKVTPNLYRFVPNDLKDDRDLFIALLSGGFDSFKRESIFKSSKWYDDLEFAIELIHKSDYSHSYNYLKKEFKVNDRILDAFFNKFPEPKFIELLPAKELGKDWFRPLINSNAETALYINDKQIVEAYLEECKDAILEKVRQSDLSWYRYFGRMQGNPMIVKALMENPLVSDRELEEAIESIENDEQLVKSVEALLEHLRKPFFNNRFFRGVDRKGMTYGQKCGDRARYANGLYPSGLNVLKVLLCDPHGTVRKNAAKRIKLSSNDILSMFDEGVPVVNNNEHSKLVIEKRKDYFVLKGLIENPAIKELDEQKVSELKAILEEARMGTSYIHVRLEGWGSEFIQGIVSGDEHKQFLEFRNENEDLSDDDAWLKFVENKENSDKNDKRSSFRDYDDVSYFLGLGLKKISKILLETFNLGNSDGQNVYEWNSEFVRNKIEDADDVKWREEKYGIDCSDLEHVDDFDQLVTYLNNDYCVFEFIIPVIDAFDPEKFHFIGVDVDEFGNEEFLGYGRYVVGLVYDGIEYYEADFLELMSHVDSSCDVYFDELEE